MHGRRAINVGITNDFHETFDGFMRDIYKDPAFKKVLKEKIAKDHRLESRDKQDSLKIRFAISYYYRDLKIKLLKEELERKQERIESEKNQLNSEEVAYDQNEETQSGDIQTPQI